MMHIAREDEGEPLDYPAPPDGLSAAALAIEPAAVWQRLESWMTHRWGARTVTWIAHGCGVFVPRLQPAELVTALRWDFGGWVPETLAPAPVGLLLDNETYELTYTVGSADTPPPAVLEAYRRLAEYWAETQADAGYNSVTDGDYSFTRSPNAMARALQHSGAADLLRRYR